MAYRYCPEGDRWLETSEYTVGDGGETICPRHKAVVGYIDGGIETERDLERELRRTYSDESLIRSMVGAAKRQNLVEAGNGASKRSASLGNRFGL